MPPTPAPARPRRRRRRLRHHRRLASPRRRGDPTVPPDGAALVGRVVDDAGAPVAAAEVSCGQMPDWSGIDFDPTEFDSEAALERVRTLREQRLATTTDDDGRFRLAVAGGSRRVSLQVRARLPSSRTNGPPASVP
jgi:hypothetical protein